MGVVNVTPDSFSDGGRYLDPASAIELALRQLDEGADLIDIGGESTRPGSRVSGDSPTSTRPVVSAEEELQRILPVIEGALARRADAIISVDTYKAAVARRAIASGAQIVNDVSGLRWDAEIASTVAGLGCGVVLMHMRGRPSEWRSLPPLVNGVEVVSRELAEMADSALRAGVAREKIVLDPGLGFGKSFEENYPLIDHFDQFQRLGFPLVAGPSRKSFIGRTLRVDEADAPPDRRLYGTLAAVTALILKGAHIVRVHDVRPAVEAARVADAILRSS
ncbi:MAG: dihydropteroate synthase [Acidobacteriaceae bacterium]|nr:dihydropteroate synthase [Acidobacteriaceae bacterium]